MSSATAKNVDSKLKETKRDSLVKAGSSIMGGNKSLNLKSFPTDAEIEAF